MINSNSPPTSPRSSSVSQTGKVATTATTSTTATSTTALTVDTADESLISPPRTKKTPRLLGRRGASSVSPGSSSKQVEPEKITSHTEPRIQQAYSSSSSSSPLPQNEPSNAAPLTSKKSSETQDNTAESALVKLLADDRLRENTSLASLYEARKMDVSFHAQNLPSPIKHLSAIKSQNYLSAKQLIQSYFAPCTAQSAAWRDVEMSYAGFKKTQSGLSEPMENAQLEAYADCFVSLIFGEAGTVEKSRLPKEVQHFLIGSDHYFHEKLLNAALTKNLSPDEMDRARLAYVDELLTKICAPLFLQLSGPDASVTEVALQVSISKHLARSVTGLHKDFLALSYASASPELQEKISLKLVDDMQEQQQNLVAKRMQQFSLGFSSHQKANKGSHPVSPRSPKSPENLRVMRAREKARDKQINQIFNQIGAQSLSDNFVDVLRDETKRGIASTEDVSQIAMQGHLLRAAKQIQSDQSFDQDEQRVGLAFIDALTARIQAADQSTSKAIDSISSTVEALEVDFLLDELEFYGTVLLPQRATSFAVSELVSDSSDDGQDTLTDSTSTSGQTTANSNTSRSNDASAASASTTTATTTTATATTTTTDTTTENQV